MDSGNSGSLQSSSGGGDCDDFDSTSSSPLSALLLRHHQYPSFAGASLVYGLHHDLATPPLSQWSSATATPVLAGSGGAQAQAASSSPPHGNGQQAPAASPPPPGQPQQPHPVAPPPRGSRKRARRASRRAPTTVLTTDTSNFRAMVQEFTGVPAPPFAAAAAARSRFDHLFVSRASSAAAAPLPPYLLRPFANKLLHAPPATAAYPQPSTSPPAPDSSIAAAPSAAAALLGMPLDHHSSYLSFQSALGAQVDGGDDAKYPAPPHAVFDLDHVLLAPPAARPPPQDPNGLSGLTAHGVMATAGEAATHLHLHPRNGGHGGDELYSGLIGAAASVVSGTGTAGGCKQAVYSSSPPPPIPPRSNGQIPSTTGVSSLSTAATTTTPAMAAAMRTQLGADSWICTSE